MFGEEATDLAIGIILGTLAMLALVIGIVLFVLAYQKRMIRHKLELQETHNKYQSDMIKSIAEVQEEERKRIASDLHDETGALLSALRMSLYQIKGNDGQQELLNEAGKMVDQSITNIRRTVKALSPSTLEKLGLMKSIEDICLSLKKTTGLDIEFTNSVGELNLEKNSEINLYRVIQEIINNSIKHSGGDKILISARTSADHLLFDLSDNGSGIQLGTEQSSGLGLKNIESRLFLINGEYTLDSSQENGTKYQIKVPLN